MENIISTRLHYDNLIDEENDPVHDPKPMQEYMNKWDGDTFINELQVNKQSNVLEIGIGTGRLALRVLNIGCNKFTGIDLSKKTIARAITNLKEFSNHELINGDFLDARFNQTFDIIYSSLTFFHIEDKELATQKVWSFLKPKGRFVLSIDKNQSDKFDYEKYIVRLFPDDLDNTVTLFNKIGFHVENINETEFAHIITATK